MRARRVAGASARALASAFIGIFLVALALRPPVVTAQDARLFSDPAPRTTAVVAVVGDVIPHQRLLESARDPRSGRYDFEPIFQHIAPYLAAADYAVANLETPLAGPAARFTGYPLFNAPLEFALALRLAGLDMCSTANNHCLDRGWPGLTATLERLDQLGLAHTGTNRTLAERQTPLIVDIRGIRVAFLAYTEALNGHRPPAPHAAYAVNRLDADQVAADAALARLWGAEIVVALVHWGEEYQRWPSVHQVVLAEGAQDCEGLLSRGVDVVIGHHPHVVQPIVRVGAPAAGPRGGYVIYSLGNFLSNQPWRYADSGLIVYLHLEKTGFRARVSGVSYLPVYVQRDARRYPAQYRVLPVLAGQEPSSDLPLNRAQKARLAEVAEELEPLAFKPEQGVVPLDPQRLGLR